MQSYIHLLTQTFVLTIGDMEPCPASIWFEKVFITEAMDDASWRNDAGTWGIKVHAKHSFMKGFQQH